ncbi:MAG: hypothetical protein BWY91_01486 [bacterium ADurb.BinA028]|nr:MAG: hypothetical protein BWY91_01486 [bacterium ADurb.BinA028]
MEKIGRSSNESSGSTSHDETPSVDSTQLEPEAQLAPPALLVKLAELSVTLV